MMINNYFSQDTIAYLIITTVVLAITLIFFLMLILRRKATVRKKQTKLETTNKSALVITSHDIRAIAGEDMIATQLDLARAYIEIGRKQLAHSILDHTIKQGNLLQRQEAIKLLKTL